MIYYKLNTYNVDPGNASYYIATLTFLGGNGTIATEGTVYTVIHFNINAGDVNLKQNFGTSTQWVINNTTGKPEPSVTLLDNNDDQIFGAVEYTNTTTITVSFDSAVSGSSILN